MSSCCSVPSSTSPMPADDVRTAVEITYAAAARQASHGRSSCCGDDQLADPGLYSEGETTALPARAVAASLGCGNPTALAELHPGETVLDLGSGGGIDVLLSARRVGPHGHVYGLDVTDEMLQLARENQREAGVINVEFLKGDIESIPLPDRSVDVIVSNCVINLAVDKDRVLREAFRVLKPGGRLAVSDIVTRGPIPEAVRQDLALWAGCVAGALDVDEYRAKLDLAGFDTVEIELTATAGCSPERGVASAASAFIRGRKPGTT